MALAHNIALDNFAREKLSRGMANGRELLVEWLKKQDLSRADFCRRTGGAISEGMLSYYLSDEPKKRRSPGLENALLIERLTDGAVEARSWVAVSSSPRRPRATKAA